VKAAIVASSLRAEIRQRRAAAIEDGGGRVAFIKQTSDRWHPVPTRGSFAAAFWWQARMTERAAGPPGPGTSQEESAKGGACGATANVRNADLRNRQYPAALIRPPGLLRQSHMAELPAEVARRSHWDKSPLENAIGPRVRFPSSCRFSNSACSLGLREFLTHPDTLAGHKLFRPLCSKIASCGVPLPLL